MNGGSVGQYGSLVGKRSDAKRRPVLQCQIIDAVQGTSDRLILTASVPCVGMTLLPLLLITGTASRRSQISESFADFSSWKPPPGCCQGRRESIRGSRLITQQHSNSGDSPRSDLKPSMFCHAALSEGKDLLSRSRLLVIIQPTYGL